ncbi:MAG: class I adenylate-forming enzyme family protein [Halanaeroarchaeum sp.]
MRDWLTIRRSATPNRTALIDAATDDRWTYRELDEVVSRLAGRLRAVGVGAGDPVGVTMETRTAFVRLLWATQRLGATLVPFNARLTPDELADRIDVVEPTVHVVGRETERTAAGLDDTAPVLGVDGASAGGVRPLDAIESEPVAPTDRPLSEPFAVVFTSGTTGDPRPIRLTGQNFLASAVASAFRLGTLPDDRWLLCLPTYHVGGLSIPIRTTVYGTTAVVHRGFDPDSVLEAMDGHSVTGISVVPTMLDRLLEVGPVPDSLRFVLVGGGPISEALLDRARDADVPVYPTYGMTEAASQIATATSADVEAAPGTVGRPLVGTDVAILDGDGDPVEPGERGEIGVRGWTISPDVFEGDGTTNGWFRTGDVGYRDRDGRLFVTGRVSETIVTGGENVVPATVREAVVEHPAVDDAAVVGIPDDEWGERVAAAIVASETMSVGELDAFLEGRLAGFKRPRTVAFVESLPRTPSGTVDRAAVRERLRDAVE